MAFEIETIKTISTTNGTYNVALDGRAQDSTDEPTQGEQYIGSKCTKHFCEIEVNGNTAGTITVKYKGIIAKTPRAVYESDGTTALVIDIATDPLEFSIDAASAINTLHFVLDSVTGGANHIRVAISSGN